MIVCIAEKPSVARDIAEVLGAKTRKDGYIEGNGYQVTWTFGHLCGLLEPHEYAPEWKAWALSHLPMIPQRFGIKVMNDSGIQKQFKVIETLMAAADEVVNCGDAGQEGELIQRWVMQKALCKCPVKRLWISSLTEEAIREGFTKLKDQSNYQTLYEAGLSRAIGDWLLGMNATRLYTLKYGKNRQVLSIGRVQTPTLALIVNRQLEIENFKPEAYWELKTIYRDTVFSATKGRFSSVEEGTNFLETVRTADFFVTDITTKKGTESAPRLFDLTSLQVECNKKFGYSADETLKIIQALYEKKVTTYPRVDTTYLSDDIYPKIPDILKGIKDYELLTKPLLAGKLPKTKKVFDNTKVTDHHAIIPTGVHPTALTDPEKRVFDLVARRFIANFYLECKISTTTVLGEVEKVEFKVTGKQILEQGWRVVFDKGTGEGEGTGEGKGIGIGEGKEEGEGTGEEEWTLPLFVKGESGPHEPTLAEKWTSPPKPYTEATLLRAMETAGKLVDNDELRDALKENGIGRPSTRAAIIETLFKRDYVRREKKNLIATNTGVELIQVIQEDLLKSAELTGRWEKKLRQVEKGEYKAKDFLDELKAMVTEIVFNVKSDNRRTTSPPTPLLEERGAVISNSDISHLQKEREQEKKGAISITSASQSTSIVIPPLLEEREQEKNGAISITSASQSTSVISNSDISHLQKEREQEKNGTISITSASQSTSVISNSDISHLQKEREQEKNGAISITSASQSTSIVIPPLLKERGAGGEVCPLCGKGIILKGKTAFGCSEWKNGCSFRKPF